MGGVGSSQTEGKHGGNDSVNTKLSARGLAPSHRAHCTELRADVRAWGPGHFYSGKNKIK